MRVPSCLNNSHMVRTYMNSDRRTSSLGKLEAILVQKYQDITGKQSEPGHVLKHKVGAGPHAVIKVYVAVGHTNMVRHQACFRAMIGPKTYA